ncbi:hypothetical protein DTO280E4_1939 [Paecilomyces variotii]|nr:hypothetical protein DTO280E4_1939 [Paecilomyces variotii]
MAKGKGVLDRKSLQGNGITFDLRVIGLNGLRNKLGEQAKKLAARLLGFHHRFVPQEKAEPLLASEDRSILHRLTADIGYPQELRKLKRLTAKAVSAHNYAMNIVAASEMRWQGLVKSELFKGMSDRALITEGARTIGVRELAKSLRVESEDTWYAAHEVRLKTASSNAPILTRPKPDLYIALPTFEEDKVPRGFARSPIMRNFCAAKLQLLADKKGLLSSPLSRIIGKRSKEKGRLCFPCVVLEAKHHEVKQSSVENCYCQAANGAACALALLHNLTGKYIASDFKRDARPVVTITLNGHQARVWIAGIKSTKNASETIATEKGSQLREFTRVRYHMQCMWKGDIHFEDPMMELICIIDNLENWINEDFRPWVSGYLGRHYHETGLRGESGGETEGLGADDEETGSNFEDSDSESSEEYDDTDEEENEWDENWIAPEGESEESDSEYEMDSDDYEEYLRDFNRADSLMEQLSLDHSAKSTTKVSHKFIQARNDRGL